MEEALGALRASTEDTHSWFGAKAEAISTLLEVARECAEPAWDGERAEPVTTLVASRAVEFIRAWPDSLELPEFSAEPDGALSLDWIRSRHRVFSLSVGESNRLAYAWLDGSDRGHGVVRFDGDVAPARIVDGVRRILTDRNAAFRAR